MAKKRSYEELAQRVKKLEKEAAERKRMEAALRDSETRSQLILQTMPSGLFTVDLTRKITYWNKEAERITGLKAEEVIGKECLEAFDCEECKRGCALFGDKVDQPICEKECVINVAGRDIAISKNAGLLTDWEGNTTGGLESFIDVTEHKRLCDALAEKEERLRAVLDSVQAGIVTIDAESHRIIDVNPVAAKMIGLPKQQIIGHVCHKFICPAEQGKCPITDLGRTIDNSERVLVKANGKSVLVLKTVASATLDGRELLIESFLDISPRKQAEEALRKAHDELERRVEKRTAELAATTEQLKLELTERKQAEEALSLAHKELKKRAADLELANEELSQYNQVAAHLLKEPLRAIRNYADFLREDLATTIDGDQKDYLDSLNGAVSQGVKLVDDLLEFAEVGGRSVPIHKIEIGVFLQELLASLNLSPDVEVVMGNDWPTLDAEPILLRQIFENLISNAMKFNHSRHRRIEIGWL
jgi:PAS domain S-box-containing protein